MIDTKTFFILIHIFGAVIGAGGAYMSDAMFFLSIRDKKISHSEMKFLRLGSTMVWTGIVLLLISGAGIFGSDPARYLASSKFVAKMSIVFFIILNGLLFRFYHVPHLHRHTGETLPSSRSFMKKSTLLLVSGAVSLSSWTFALILGSLQSLPLSTAGILTIYFITTTLTSLVTIALKPVIFRKKK